MSMEIAVRVAVTEGSTTTRADLVLTGSRGLMTVDGRRSTFPSADVWKSVRGLLPDLETLRAAPARSTAADERPSRAEDATVAVVVATSAQLADGSETAIVVRTWAADEQQLYVVEPGAVRTARTGALADLLVWDVTGAMEAQVRSLEVAS